MNVLYHMTGAPPPLPGTDALYQEVSALERRFGGSRVHLYPFRRQGLASRFQYLAGMHLLPRLIEFDRRVQLHHVFDGGLRHYPVLRALKRPIVYTVVAGLQGTPSPPSILRRRLRAVIVASQRNRALLEDRGFDNVTVIRPGIDVSRFTCQPLPLRSEVTLLIGSAPWVKEQFATKGFDTLFAIAARRPQLRLVLLWRGLLERELEHRLAAFGIQDRVEVVTGVADVNALLARVHGAVVLTRHAHLIKEYPHSLIEALVAGKPVVVSGSVAMADYVEEHRCGVVVDRLTESAVEAAVDRLVDGYDRYQPQALAVARRDFALETMLDRYQHVYESCGLVSNDAVREVA